eukprot:TRINITY_DN126709_c0_g1_i1.p1 TRINITY_DN126709_c0_g1~~TRINITY_DN126709_c0_g1_i1.p1  ORF type:complete len:153 (-),score=30.18 TRINITY_DN126709_c0_g1_i1:93-551(-)
MCLPEEERLNDGGLPICSKQGLGTAGSCGQRAEASKRPSAASATRANALSLKELVDAAATASPADTTSLGVRAAKALQALERLSEEKKPRATWAMLHRFAIAEGRPQYLDPETGLRVFTSSFLRSQPCCGYNCRHCPHAPDASHVAATVPDW